LEGVVRVKELIEKLKALDPDALVVYWPDIDDSSGYSAASDIRLVYVDPTRPDMVYSYEPKDGLVTAVEII
jgi:hypothetical protein